MRVTVLFHWIFLAIGLLLSHSSYAFEVNDSDFRFNGFGSLGISHTDNDRIAARDVVSQKGTFDEWSMGLNSNLGLQFNYAPTDKLKFAAQLLIKERPNNSFNKSLNWAYIGYEFTSEIEVRLGRMGVNSFMLSDYRNVGYAQLWTHPPVEFYGQFGADYGDGLNLIHKAHIADGLLRTQFWLSQGKFFYYTQDGETTLDVQPTYGVTFNWENDVWTYRATMLKARLIDKKDDYQAFQQTLRSALPLWPEINSFIDEISVDNSMSSYYGLGFGYNKSDWVIQGEVSLIETESALTNRSKAGYILLGHRFNSVTPYVVAATVKNDRVHIPDTSNIALTSLQVTTQLFANYFHQDQQTLSLGTRWDIEPKLAIKAQLDRTWVGPYGGSLLYQQLPSASTEIINRFTLTLDFVF